jgi:tol-pal system protein YbgF
MQRTGTALVLLVLLGAAPLGAANREHQQMMAELRMMQEQNQQLQVMLAQLTDALKTVTSRLDDQGNVTRKAFADAKLLVDNVAGDVRILREKVDDTNVRISSLSQEVEALRLAIPRMTAPAAPVDPTTGAPVPQDPSDPAAPPGGTPAAPPPFTGLSPQRLYDSAYSDYTAGQWSLAIQGFETYIKTFPRSEMADDAQYYIGEAYFNDGRVVEAVAAFDQVISAHPKGDVVPAAWYKKGLALERLGRKAEARTAFETIVRDFPDSVAARMAKQRLDQGP